MPRGVYDLHRERACGGWCMFGHRGDWLDGSSAEVRLCSEAIRAKADGALVYPALLRHRSDELFRVARLCIFGQPALYFFRYVVDRYHLSFSSNARRTKPPGGLMLAIVLRAMVPVGIYCRAHLVFNGRVLAADCLFHFGVCSVDSHLVFSLPLPRGC